MAKKSGSGGKKSDSSSGSVTASGNGTHNGSASGSGAAAAATATKSKPLKPQPLKPQRWGDEPDAHDYPAAASFLSLICDPSEVRRLVTALKAAPIVHFKAKDLLRASTLALLPSDNFHVAIDLTKIARGQRLSPVLLMRGDFRRGVPLTVADGYHRICASYHVDENADIPCHLVDHKGPTAVPGFRLGSGIGTAAGPGAGTGAGPGAPTGPETGGETVPVSGSAPPLNADGGSDPRSLGGPTAPGGQ
jgi:hypothetical protein